MHIPTRKTTRGATSYKITLQQWTKNSPVRCKIYQTITDFTSSEQIHASYWARDELIMALNNSRWWHKVRVEINTTRPVGLSLS
jgi:hypothetical protein